MKAGSFWVLSQDYGEHVVALPHVYMWVLGLSEGIAEWSRLEAAQGWGL